MVLNFVRKSIFCCGIPGTSGWFKLVNYPLPQLILNFLSRFCKEK
jgi:hypothetical protein